MRQGAQRQCTGMTLRDGMGRVVGGGSGWGTHVHSGLIHVSVLQKPPQYCKVISLQLKKICLIKKKKSLESKKQETISEYDIYGNVIKVYSSTLLTLKYSFLL